MGEHKTEHGHGDTVAELTMTARREDCGCLSAELSTTLDEAEAAKLMRSAAERLDGGKPDDETVALQAAAIGRALNLAAVFERKALMRGPDAPDSEAWRRAAAELRLALGEVSA